MKKIVLLMVIGMIIISCTKGNAQVTIGSEVAPEKAALLDLKTKDGGAGLISSEAGGVLLPRVEISDTTKLDVFTNNALGVNTDEQKLRHKGLTVYNIGTANVDAGIYVWNGKRWEKTSYNRKVNFFYMPSIVIDTRTTGAQTPINLYQKYVDQFMTPKVRSNGAPAQIPFYASPQDLYYYVTDYDESVFENISISNTGMMSYSVKAAATAGSSFINIVFVIK